jgi:hypothetical protein
MKFDLLTLSQYFDTESEKVISTKLSTNLNNGVTAQNFLLRGLNTNRMYLAFKVFHFTYKADLNWTNDIIYRNTPHISS